MTIEYVSKRWLSSPQTIKELVRRLGHKLIGALDEDNYITQRRGIVRDGDVPTRFYVLHISWGGYMDIQKYKLYRVTING